MPFVKNNVYREIPFCKETRQVDFYTYCDVRHLTSKCQQSGNEVVRCRTIGILQSIYGKFYLTELETPLSKNEPEVTVSMMYLKVPPQSTVMPYAVQVFGTLQWKNRPVIYAKILQVLNVAIALRLRDALTRVVTTHRADEQDDVIEEI